MSQVAVFSYDSYKNLLGDLLSGPSNRGQLTKAAEFLNCQRSYLSRVLSENLHLTPDHAFNLCDFFKFNFSERDYFLALVDFDRSGDAKYRKYLKEKLTKLRSESESLKNRLKKDVATTMDNKLFYFSSWLWTAIHFLVCCEKYQTVSQLSMRLNLPEAMTLRYLLELEKQGYVSCDREVSPERWKFLSGDFHLGAQSPSLLMHHQNWRARALVNAQNYDIKDNVHFTGVFTLSHHDAVRIKEKLLNFLQEVGDISRPSLPEDCTIINCDLFQV